MKTALALLTLVGAAAAARSSKVRHVGQGNF